LKLQPRQGDIVKFVKEISFSFVDLAERKNISFSYHDPGHSLLTLFDHDKIERILFNLLSNAFKFTPENGAVSVTVDTEYQAETVLLSIKVQDSGIGIAPDKQEKIFERFFQNDIPDTMLNQGSGIGLAITQEFVRMHNGSCRSRASWIRAAVLPSACLSFHCRQEAFPLQKSCQQRH
jgi:signal transduction histidine kinase